MVGANGHVVIAVSTVIIVFQTVVFSVIKGQYFSPLKVLSIETRIRRVHYFNYHDSCDR